MSRTCPLSYGGLLSLFPIQFRRYLSPWGIGEFAWWYVCGLFEEQNYGNSVVLQQKLYLVLFHKPSTLVCQLVVDRLSYLLECDHQLDRGWGLNLLSLGKLLVGISLYPQTLRDLLSIAFDWFLESVLWYLEWSSIQWWPWPLPNLSYWILEWVVL